MRRNRIVTLALLVALFGVTLHISTPRPAMALTCQQQCQHDYFPCLHGCGLMCIGDDACYAACSGECEVQRADCLSNC
jgi:hypothetical protein